ncbi:MAG: PQQ-dependent sugar dehydrogenase [Thermosynechococcaceae cyanobacterium]
MLPKRSQCQNILFRSFKPTQRRFAQKVQSGLGLLGILLGANLPSSVQATVPPGFQATVKARNLASPTAMAIAPDGRVFIAEQAGRIRVVKGSVLRSQPFLNIKTNVDSIGERGLLGIAFDPDFVSNQWIYVYYTSKTPTIHNRVSRFTANGDVVVPRSEKILLDIQTLSGGTSHNGGAIHFGKDGQLYIAVGENTQQSNAQTLDNLKGKLLRINKNGSIPTDNPFFTTAKGKNRAIWALGLRNPFTFAVQPGTGRIHINDVGGVRWEEINKGVKGANYGWPIVEGKGTDARFRNPLLAYAHGGGNSKGCAIVGAAFYNPTTVQFPAKYVGDYFYGDFCSGWIRRYDTTTRQSQVFATGLNQLSDLQVSPDGKLYYLERGGGVLTAVTYSSSK